MSEAGDVKSTGREDAKEQLANAGGPVVGISWHRSVSCSLGLFVGNCNCLGKTTSVQTLSFSLSLCLFPSSGVFSALQDCEIEGMGPGFLFYHSSDQAGLPTHLQTTGYRQKRS